MLKELPLSLRRVRCFLVIGVWKKVKLTFGLAGGWLGFILVIAVIHSFCSEGFCAMSNKSWADSGSIRSHRGIFMPWNYSFKSLNSSRLEIPALQSKEKKKHLQNCVYKSYPRLSVELLDSVLGPKMVSLLVEEDALPDRRDVCEFSCCIFDKPELAAG